MSVLFDETAINGMKLKNRFVRSATWEARGTHEGSCTDALIDFTVELARGGVGLIIMGHAYVLQEGKATPHQTGIYDDALIDGLSVIAPKVHEYGSKLALQISHCGGHVKSEWRSGRLLAPSSFENIYGDVTEEMSTAEVQEIIQAFAEAGMRTKRAGFDAVQIHGAHTYLVNQFLSPVWNQRQDAYGGGIENRSRFLFEVYEGIREKVGDDFPILIKLSSDDGLEGGFSIDEAIWVSKRLADMGVAAIEVSGGSRYAGVDKAPVRTGIVGEKDEAYFAENTRRIKEHVDVPVMTVGGIRSFEVAERIIQTGVADYVALSRPLICEPDLVNRWKSGDRSKSKCLSDNKCLTPGYEEEVRCEIRK